MSYFIYKITNLVNNKIYIGYTKNPDKRFKEHIKDARLNKTNQYIHKAIRKYGPINFSFFILENRDNKSDALETEKYWITFFKSNNNKFGYNLTEGGEGGDYSKFWSIKGKQNIIENNKKRSMYQRNKTYEEIYGEERSLIIKNKISKANKGKTLNLTNEEKSRRSNLMLTNNPMRNGHTPESKQKISSTLKKLQINSGDKNAMRKYPELRNMISERNSKIHHLQNILTNEEVYIKNLKKWSLENNFNPSTVSVRFSQNSTIGNWKRISSFTQSEYNSKSKEKQNLSL